MADLRLSKNYFRDVEDAVPYKNTSVEYPNVGAGAANSCPYPLSLRDISLYYRESPDSPLFGNKI